MPSNHPSAHPSTHPSKPTQQRGRLLLLGAVLPISVSRGKPNWWWLISSSSIKPQPLRLTAAPYSFPNFVGEIRGVPNRWGVLLGRQETPCSIYPTCHKIIAEQRVGRRGKSRRDKSCSHARTKRGAPAGQYTNSIYLVAPARLLCMCCMCVCVWSRMYLPSCI